MKFPIWGVSLVRAFSRPPWKPTQTAYQYLAKFNSHIDNKKRYYHNYSQYNQAAKILQQATTHEQYKLIATSYLMKLMTSHQQTLPRDLPPEFTPNNLINLLETSKVHSSRTPSHAPPHTSKFQCSKPFVHKVPKQCQACRV